jgi:trimeric autotransporter adhesin
MKTKSPRTLRRIVAGLCGFLASELSQPSEFRQSSEPSQHTDHRNCHPERRRRTCRRSRRTCSSPLWYILLASALALTTPLLAQTTGPQQLVFTGLLGSTNPTTPNAQFNAVQSDASGNLYLLLDQKDGVRLLKTDPTATNILAQTQLGSAGDIGLALALDPSGNIYIAGTTTSGTMAATSGAAFPSATDTSTNAFIGKFDQNLNPLFITYAGSGHLSVAGIAATADAVFLTGSIFTATLPVTPSAIIQSPAFNTLQNGFVERFNATGTTLVYATYLSGQAGNTAPATITADTSDNAYIAGYTTSSGYPTLAALIPNILSPTSGFLTKLTPAGDGILFSTFIPGPGIASIAIELTTQTLLLSGSLALGQFPIATVSTPLVNTTYQTLLRLPLDGSTVLASTLLAPGTQSTLTPAPNQNTWVTSTLTTPSWFLPLAPLSTIGNSYALRVSQQNQIDQTLRIGGLPTTNPNFASAPVTLTSLTTDSTGEPIFAGSASPTASSSLLATETYDLPLYNTPTPALPSTLRAAILLPADCTGSLCSGSAAYLTKLNATSGAPSLTLSTDATPNLTLRNLGSVAATNLQLTATNFILAHNCPTTLAPGAECTIALTSTSANPGTLTAQADNTTTQSITLPASTTTPNPIAFSPKELDFGIVTSTSPAVIRTITVTNLTPQSQTFTSKLGSNQLTPYTFSESSSTCPLIANNTYTLAANATCTITLSFTASPTSTDDGFAQSNWTIGPGSVLLTAYTQAASLNLSATEIDFGTQFPGGIQLPRYLYLSNSSATSIPHTPVTLASPFTLTDNCPTTLEPHTVCQLQITYKSPIAPSADSITLTLDQGLTVLITGSNLSQPTGTGQSVNPNLTVTPAAITFPTPVLVTGTSTTTESVAIANIGTQPFPLTLAITGDFTFTTDCPATLPGNSTCTVLITFAPSQPGTRQGLLSVSAGSGTSPTFVNLTGIGTAITTTPNSTLAFGDVLLGQPSVQWTKITSPFSTLTATTSAPDFKAILVEDIGYGHGAPPTGTFTSTFTGPCTNCWLGVQFTPSTTGPQTAALTLTSTTSGTPSPFTLTGTGLPLTGLILTPPTQDFGPIAVHSTSAPTLFTLTNLTTETVGITAPTTTANFALADSTHYPTGGPTCNGPLAPNASCFVNITFSPTTTGPLTGTLTIGTITATLTGFGSPDPGLALNPTALIFNNVPSVNQAPTSTQQTITLTNTSSTTLQIATPTTATPTFSSTTNCTTLAPTATCNITVTFTPTNALTTDTLQIPVINSLTGLTSYTVPLTGNYTIEDSGLQILPNQSSYAPTPTATLGPTRQFTINNLTLKSLTLNVALPRQFVLSSPPCAALAPNASCQFSVTFLPLTNGDITGTLFAQATPTDGSATINGLGYVQGYGIGTSSLVITGNIIPSSSGPGNPLNFGQVSSGQSSQQTLTLTNQGAIPLTIRRITSEWPFLVTATTCGSALATNQNCAITLTYTPLNQGASGTTSPQSNTDTGTLVIESDSLTAPDFIELTGTAAPTSVTTPNNTAPLVSYTASQSSLTFATTQVGDAAQPQSITLSNTGTVPIHITALQTTPDFTIQSAQSNCTTILPSASCLLTIAFTPQPSATNSNTRISALEITSDASIALDFISVLGTATPSPLVLAPISLDFGSVQLGTTSTLPLQITNTSTAPVTFNNIATTGDYAPAGNCPTPGNTLAPNTTCTEQITFTPTQTGTRPGSVAVSTSLSSLPITAPLTGIGIQSHLQITPSALNFGSIAIGASANLALTLSNLGTAPVTNLALTPNSDYALTTPCTTTTLAPNTTCTATITFTPTTLGPRTSTLIITSSDANSPTLIPLTGNGAANGSFILTVNGNTSASATIASEYPVAYSLQLTPQNNYTGDVILNCTPINPGQYATCLVLPSSITLNGAAQNAIATINTITSINPATTAHNATHTNLTRTALCLLPAGLLFFWRTRLKTPRKKTRTALSILLLTLTTLWPSGCGSGGDPNIRITPPGTYQYQVTASSATGVQLTQSVTLNITVTAH